ncbi:TonB-dependent siderophore receptor [Pseudomonas quasicaspiana]|uniref:TonB-dependent siderophore receptor n=1 Tax=Pseudomonas quasicaspiana TaxID=2829821 RepID=UPI001E2C84D4|nr:TonB-dependent siderophore receptor [Pseudomonas quasicaspiana]MCD5979601.1 TonB-dependent siderophore receptor [Pseudomonas quasicaspiana]
MFCHPLKRLVVAMSLAFAGHAMAAPVSLDLPSQPLAISLRQLGETARLTIAVDDSIVGQRNAPAIKGNLEPLDALRRLLDGSGLTYQQQGSTLIISPRNDSAIELGATSIQGQGMGEATENSGSYTTGLTSVGSKTPTSLRQTPQSISIVSQQLMADQQMTDINDAMRATPGITLQNDTYRTSYILSRGFKLENFQLDGAAPMAQGSSVGSFYSSNIYDLAEFDHIEVLRGSAALFGGTGDPGGIVNMVRKRPLDAFQLKLTASAGNWDNYRQELDVTGPIAFDGKLRGRMVVANTDRQYFIDNRSTEKPLVYGVVEADVTDDTMLTAGFRYNKSHENGTQTSVPRYLDGSDIGLSRSASLGTKWGYTDVTGREVFAKIDHKLSDDWKVNISYTDLWDVGYFKTSTVLGVGVNPATGAGLSWNSTTSKQENQQRMWDVNLAGKFELFGLEHDVVVGGDYQEINSRWLGAARVSGGALNPLDPDSTPFPEPADNTNYSRDYNPNDQKQYGVYGSLRLQLAEPLHLILGARVQRFKFNQIYQTRAGNTWTTQSDIPLREPTKVTPYGGLVYDLNDEWSVYGSYSEIYKPQASLRDGQGNVLEAMQGKTYETGLKGELFGGRVNTNVALYYTTRENQGVRDPGYPQDDFDFAGSCCYVSNGKVVSKGIDMEVSGEVMPDWMLMAGYTFNMNRNKDADAPLSTMTPKHLFKMFSTYRLPGVFSDFKVGGGVNLQSSNYFSGEVTSNGAKNAYDFSQPGYAVWNALAEYRVDEHWTVTYNANNIFDKNYYATVGSTSATNWYGEPRNHMLTLRGTFW